MQADSIASLVAACPLPIQADDLDGSVTWVNPAFCAAFGYAERECLGQPAVELIVPADGRAAFEETRARVAAGVPAAGTGVRRTKDGRRLDVAFDAAPIVSDGVCVGTVVMYKDITTRVQTEQASQATESLLRTLTEEVPVGIFLMDVTGKTLYQNADFGRITGLSQDDTHLGRVTPGFPDDRDLVSRHLPHSFAGRLLQTEFRFVKPDGDAIWLSHRGKPIRAADGSVQSWLGVVEDITSQHETLQRLRRAKTAAEDASRAKGEYIADVSREIRTPIQSTLAMTQVVLDTELTVEQRDCLALAKESAGSLLRFFDEMQDLGTLEVPHVEAEGVAFSPREHLTGLLNALTLQAGRKQLDLIGQVLADVPNAVVGHPDRLRQVLLNLVDNALKFTEHGSVRVLVYVESEAPGGVSLHYAVSDTGIGVDRDQQQRLFPTLPLDTRGTPQRFGETGLGLAISTALVDRMGGRIWVESEPRGGSTFHFTARLGVEHTERDRNEAAVASNL